MTEAKRAMVAYESILISWLKELGVKVECIYEKDTCWRNKMTVGPESINLTLIDYNLGKGKTTFRGLRHSQTKADTQISFASTFLLILETLQSCCCAHWLSGQSLCGRTDGASSTITAAEQSFVL